MIINDRICSGIFNEIKVWILFDNGYKILLCIPAVTKYDNIFLLMKLQA